ncbi:transposase family protein [Saccharopolyspora hattusasensis]|uniref:transposase family protein n=1 Tax=Saccharopolyspora hattusasensis TaxID=1128679 RepID=UPI003D99D1B2
MHQDLRSRPRSGTPHSHEVSHISLAKRAYQGTHAITPRKKPKGGELSTNDKANNKTISSIRSAVERCIAHVKNWKILATGYRGRLAELPTIIRIIAALEFYRLGW